MKILKQILDRIIKRIAAEQIHDAYGSGFLDGVERTLKRFKKN
jgi:hypothetical protein